MVRGRRQVGKSRLVTEFSRRAGAPVLFSTASRQASVRDDLDRFAADAARESDLPGAALFDGAAFPHWEAALRTVAAALPTDGPAVVVLDEFPWLLESDPGIDGALQKMWDTVLESRPVLLVLIGSDLAVMEALSTHGRPLFGRAAESVVRPLHPADTADLLGVPPADAFDSQLVTGGYPRLLLERRRQPDLDSFLAAQLDDENSPLITTGERIIAAEFPASSRAVDVLSTIGSGEDRFTTIAAASGVAQAVLARALRTLVEQKRVVALHEPVSLRPRRDPRYRLADPYLSFWWRFLRPRIDDVARGRGDVVLRRWREAWPSYRGGAVEPLVREALARMAGRGVVPAAEHVGGWWTRTGDVELDVVGVDRWPKARRIAFVGSVKWREKSAFDDRDAARLVQHRAQLDGAAGVPMIATTRVRGRDLAGIVTLGPEDLIEAWR
jgi:AAA+ ATPase superfamily predicted ATPase